MANPNWFLRIVNVVIPNFGVAAKLSHWPILGKLVDRIFFQGDRAFYLINDQAILDATIDDSKKTEDETGARKKISIDRKLDLPEEVVVPSEVLEYFISQAEHRWLMNFCPCRTSSKCEHYDRDFGCIFLGESVLRINSDWGRLVSKEEAIDHVKKASEQGLINLIGKNRIDTIWLDAKPGHQLLTICSCCPCCCIWKNLPLATQDIGSRTTRMPGVHVNVDVKSCRGCGRCARQVCVFKATVIEGGKARKTEQCRACGKCINVCPRNAITLRIEDRAFIEETINGINDVIDLR